VKVQRLGQNVEKDTFLVDDGSTDGTSLAVRRRFPDVKLISGDGSLFWNGGMRLAFQEAINHGYDYYLWLNDDTILYPKALNGLLNIASKHAFCLIVGSVCDPDTNTRTYGGVRCASKFLPLRFKPVMPDKNKPLTCETFNGNCVLIPKDATDRIGNLSPDFTHGMGDFDYGLRATKAGLCILVAPGYYGICTYNPASVHFDKNQPIWRRLKVLHSPKGLPPREWMLFSRRHAPYIWPLYWLKLYLRVFFP
jgi:GT2 family glycosyltransferase